MRRRVSMLIAALLLAACSGADEGVRTVGSEPASGSSSGSGSASAVSSEASGSSSSSGVDSEPATGSDVDG
jgi:hypothetical protein